MITNKKKLIIIGGLALLYILGGGCDPITYAQEVPTIDEQSGEISNQSDISDKIEDNDKIEEIEQPEYLKELSDEINKMFQDYLENSLEIGGKPAYSKIINGRVCYFVEGLDCPLGKIEFGENIQHNLTAGINYGISQGFKDMVSIFGYTPEEINILKNTIETEGEKTFIYVKLKDIEDTKSSAQNKEE